MPKKKLDYLLIPNSGGEAKKEREKRALKELKNREVDNIIILKGKDSEEDILYIGKILKSGDKVGFDTFSLHYKEYRTIIRKAIKQGKFPKGVKIENVRTKQNLKQEIYGTLGLEEEKLMHEKVEYQKDRHDKLFRKLKNFIKEVLDKI